MNLQSLLRPAVGVALHWYYRSITIANASRIPRDGPVFLAVNHPNALVDALVVGWAAPRPVLFTAKATIFSTAIAARFLRAAGVVPLRRASDELAGIAATTVPAAPATQSATTAALDASRNASSFAAVADALAAGGAVVIFPEGKSHDEPRLAPLRTGLARMAVMARDERNVRGIRIIPIGLLFERKEEPRTRVLLQVGEPIEVDEYRGTNPVATITDAVRQRLDMVTLNFESAEDASRIQAAGETLAALSAPQGGIKEADVPLQDMLAMLRRTDRVSRALHQKPMPILEERIATFEHRLAAFRQRLGSLGIRAEDLSIATDFRAGALLALREAVRAVFVLPVVLWGRLTHFVPIRVARALATRSVPNRDEPAMRTIIFGTAIVLATYVVMTAVVIAAFGIWWGLAFLVSLIPSASNDMRYGDRTRRVRARARAWREFRKQPTLQRELRAEADWLRTEAGAIERLALGES